MQWRERTKKHRIWICIPVFMAVILMAAENRTETEKKIIQRVQTIIDHCEAAHIPLPREVTAVLNRLKFGQDLERPKDRYNQNSRLQTNTMSTVTEIVGQQWNGISWENEQKEVITFSDDMEHMLSLVSYEWESGTWVFDDRMLYTYDAQNQLTVFQIDIWLEGAWVVFLRETMAYDGSGNLIEEISELALPPFGILENDSRIVHTYQDGRLVQSDEYGWYSSWLKIHEILYTYDGQGQMTEMTIYAYANNSSSPEMKWIYTYDGAGNLETETRQRYITETLTWNNDFRYLYAHNGNGDLTSNTYQIWDESVWLNVNQYTATYNSGLLMTEVWKTWEGSVWQNEEFMQYTYNGNGDVLTYLDQVWYGGNWTDVEMGTNSYDAQGQLTHELIQIWYYDFWKNDRQFIHTYPNETDVADETGALPEQLSLSNYPNPFNPSTTIRFTLPAMDQITVTICDASGRTVRALLSSETLSAGLFELYWDGKNSDARPVASGIYFYSVHGEKVNGAKRCLLIK